MTSVARTGDAANVKMSAPERHAHSFFREPHHQSAGEARRRRGRPATLVARTFGLTVYQLSLRAVFDTS
jgi:hypothetical protein